MSGRMVRYARRRGGMTQRELAAKAGIPQETIARIEKGRVDPRVSTLDRLLEAAEFGLEIEPRLGRGIDRTLFHLGLSPGGRALWAGQSNENVMRVMTDMRRSVAVQRHAAPAPLKP